MTETLHLEGNGDPDTRRIGRLNRLPIALALIVLFLPAIFLGLNSRGLITKNDTGPLASDVRAALGDADQRLQRRCSNHSSSRTYDALVSIGNETNNTFVNATARRWPASKRRMRPSIILSSSGSADT